MLKVCGSLARTFYSSAGFRRASIIARTTTAVQDAHLFEYTFTPHRPLTQGTYVRVLWIRDNERIRTSRSNQLHTSDYNNGTRIEDRRVIFLVDTVRENQQTPRNASKA